MNADISTGLDVDQLAAQRPDHWDQQTIAEANGSLFKVARGLGQTNWHAHSDQDELFLVTHGELVIELRDGEVSVGAGQLYVVPAHTEHRPRADDETRFLIVGRSVTSTPEGGKPN